MKRKEPKTLRSPQYRIHEQDGLEYVHEHFATLRHDIQDKSFENYAIHREKKIKSFTKSHGARFIFTYGEDEHGRKLTCGEILSDLERKLDSLGIRRTPTELPPKEINEMVGTYVSWFFEIKKTLNEKNINIEKITSVLNNDKDIPPFVKLFWNLIYLPLNGIYKRELRTARHSATDFEDCISWAEELLIKHPSKKRFHYDAILVDEYQDITSNRLQFLKTLVGPDSRNTQLFAVGDDWQSIYSFSGSELRFFSNFKNMWTNANVFNLGETFRFGEPLVELSGKFVLKDNPELTERIVTGKGSTNLYLYPVSFKRLEDCKTDEEWKKLNDENDKLQAERVNSIIKLFKINNNNRIGIFARYNRIVDHVRGYFQTENNTIISMHKSKGITVDYAFVLSCNDGCIPSTIEDNIIKKTINSVIGKIHGNQEESKECEERRLFYVAMTRAKKATFLIYDKDRPSIFIKELEKMDGVRKI